MTRKKLQLYARRLSHCQQRLRGRYGMSMSTEQYAALCKLLAQGPRDPLYYTHRGREVLPLWLEGREVVAVYDCGERLIVTFLPQHSHNPRRGKPDRHAHHRDRKLRQRRRRLKNKASARATGKQRGQK